MGTGIGEPKFQVPTEPQSKILEMKHWTSGKLINKSVIPGCPESFLIVEGCHRQRMGVHGLWKLIDPAGKPIPLETLENRILAVDVSIWLYQLTKGLQTAEGGAVSNAHILGLFNRICKLIHYRIRPVFVFDGSAPELKKETIHARKRQKIKAKDSLKLLREKLLSNISKQKAISSIIDGESGSSTSHVLEKNLFELPPMPAANDENHPLSDDDDSSFPEHFTNYAYNLHSFDISSEQFRCLPAEIRHEILSELVETRKQSSWNRVDEIPEESNEFSNYQMQRLIKRRNVQKSLDAATQEIGDKIMTLGELEETFRQDGIVSDSLTGKRIAKDGVTRYIYFSSNELRKNSKKETQVDELPNLSQKQVNIGQDDGTQLSIDLLNEEENDNSDAEAPNTLIKNDAEAPNTLIKSDAEAPNTLIKSGDEATNILIKSDELSQEEILQIIKNDFEKRKAESPQPCSSNSLREIQNKFLDPSNICEKHNDVKYECDLLNKSSNIPDRYTCEETNSQTRGSTGDCEISDAGSNLSSSVCSSPVKHDAVAQSERSRGVIDGINSSSDTNIPDQNCTNVESSESDDEGFIEVPMDEYCPYFNKQPNRNLNTNDGHNMNLTEMPSDYHEKQKLLRKSSNVINFSQTNDHKTGDEVIISREPCNKSTVLSDPELSIKETATIESGAISDSLQTLISTSSDSETENNDTFLSGMFDVGQIPRDELMQIQHDLQVERSELASKAGKQERLGSSITQQMVIEAQELLQLFGLPYIIAPMEAESQCAFLEKAALTEGTITDDSDIWLFGGRTVYKNFFHNQKNVMQFKDIEIENIFNLSREKLIQLALLVGSDYTIGIDGIGPVTALEILAYFSDEAKEPKTEQEISITLEKFKTWVNSGRYKSSKFSVRIRNLQITENFPNLHVIKSYLHPSVDESKEGFTWATPDLDRIRHYMKTKFGWRQAKVDEILLPVLKRMNKRSKQATLDKYFSFKPGASSIDRGQVSQRVMQAINTMKSKVTTQSFESATLPSRKKNKIKSSTAAVNKRGSKARTAPSLLTSSDGKKNPAAINNCSVFQKYNPELIPQREKARLDASKRKIEAAKIFKAAANFRKDTKKKRLVRNINYLSESSSDE